MDACWAPMGRSHETNRGLETLKPPSGQKSLRERPRKRWMDCGEEDLKETQQENILEKGGKRQSEVEEDC